MKAQALVLVGIVALLGLTAHFSQNSESQVLTSAKKSQALDLNQAESNFF
jgi:hypothetical protein